MIPIILFFSTAHTQKFGYTVAQITIFLVKVFGDLEIVYIFELSSNHFEKNRWEIFQINAVKVALLLFLRNLGSR